MKKARKMPELVLQLKAAKAERGLSNADITAELQKRGYSTSLSTVKRVFAEGSEFQSFWYGESIQPIEELLLIEAPPVPIDELESIEDAQQYVSQIEGLQAAASFKDELMSELKASNEKKEATNKKLEEELASYKKKLWLVAGAFIVEALLFTLYFVIR